MDDKRFPVLMSAGERRLWPQCPRSVPWTLLAPHAAQAHANHYQSLECLAERGGLDPVEMVAVLEDHDYPHGGDRHDKMRYAVQMLVAISGIEAVKHG